MISARRPEDGRCPGISPGGRFLGSPAPRDDKPPAAPVSLADDDARRLRLAKKCSAALLFSTLRIFSPLPRFTTPRDARPIAFERASPVLSPLLLRAFAMSAFARHIHCAATGHGIEADGWAPAKTRYIFAIEADDERAARHLRALATGSTLLLMPPLLSARRQRSRGARQAGRRRRARRARAALMKMMSSATRVASPPCPLAYAFDMSSPLLPPRRATPTDTR